MWVLCESRTELHSVCREYCPGLAQKTWGNLMKLMFLVESDDLLSVNSCTLLSLSSNCSWSLWLSRDLLTGSFNKMKPYYNCNKKIKAKSQNTEWTFSIVVAEARSRRLGVLVSFITLPGEFIISYSNCLFIK